MKPIFYLLLLLPLLIACQDDDANIDPYLIHHDGNNVGSPALPAGSYEAGAHFTSSYVDQYGRKDLSAIEYFVYERPSFAEIRVSESLNRDSPGNIIFSQEVTNQLLPFSWNTVFIGNPIPIEGGFWLSLYFENDVNNILTMGCDEGPRESGGDWLFDSYDQVWETFQVRLGENVNWNLRGVLQD